ncbi:MAG: tetratricopeptide repeat protein [Bacteroidetes bacterium]|nr:tetratricopeptide repeat protein [Bacteroidota bacterium]
MKNCVFIPLAIFCCQATFSQSSDSSQAYYQKGITEKNARRFMVAYKNFQKSVEFKKDNVDAQTQLGLTALELRDYGNAEVAFLKVNELKKDDPVAIENLANIYFWTHQWKQAIEFGEKAKQLNVGKNWNYNIGKCYYQQEDYGNAFKYLQAAWKEDSSNAEVPYLLARGFVDMNNYKAAIPFFKKAIALDSSRSQWIYECALTLATIYDDKTAIQYYLVAAQKGYKTDNDYYENLSDSYVAAGQPEKGIELMLGILEKKPADLILLYSVANAYYKIKKYQEAIDYWDKILYFDKENAKALYMIGMAYQKKGETDKGRQLCDKAIAMDPSLKSLKQEKNMSMGL